MDDNTVTLQYNNVSPKKFSIKGKILQLFKIRIQNIFSKKDYEFFSKYVSIASVIAIVISLQ